MAIDKNELQGWLDSLDSMYHGASVTNTSVRVIKKKVLKELINIPLDSLFELYGNLILAGFEKDEAITIIVSLIRDYERTK